MLIQVVRSHLVCNDANKHGNSRNGVYDDLFLVKFKFSPDETDVWKSPELPQEVGLLVMDIFLLAAIWHITICDWVWEMRLHFFSHQNFRKSVQNSCLHRGCLDLGVIDANKTIRPTSYKIYEGPDIFRSGIFTSLWPLSFKVSHEDARRWGRSKI